MDIQEEQQKFMNEAGQLAYRKPVDAFDVFTATEEELWRNLIEEETNELQEAIKELQELTDELRLENPFRDATDFSVEEQAEVTKKLAAIGKEAVDVIYVVMGLMNSLGLPFEEIFKEVHKSNMAKFEDVVIKDNGKVLKPANWKKPDIVKVIAEARTKRT